MMAHVVIYPATKRRGYDNASIKLYNVKIIAYSYYKNETPFRFIDSLRIIRMYK